MNFAQITSENRKSGYNLILAQTSVVKTNNPPLMGDSRNAEKTLLCYTNIVSLIFGSAKYVLTTITQVESQKTNVIDSLARICQDDDVFWALLIFPTLVVMKRRTFLWTGNIISI
ncbi:MAG: hypothetical protein CUN52_00575 [Phototrophicales bacterium]|jgi:hypothetical protein|nr:MAG: hypothetical protein CUN52_00575 [Phototrophicales bacterium]